MALAGKAPNQTATTEGTVRVFGWGLDGLGWIQSSFWDGANLKECLVAL